MRYLTILSAIVATLLQGCNTFDFSGGGGGPSENDAFVITSDFVTGSFAIIDLKGDRDVTPSSPARSVNSDAVVRVHDDRVYVINRMGDESIQVLDPNDDYATLSRCSTGAGTNPHDIAVVSGNKAYVTLFNETDLLIVDPSVDEDCDGFIIGSIDLSVFADADGIPEMDQMAIIDDRLYVSIEHLDRDNFFAPTGLGQIAVIDIDDDEVIGEIALGASNPFGATKGLTVDGRDLLVSLTGQFGVRDGGIQRVDAVNQELEPFIVTEAVLGGDVTDFVIVSNRVGYAVISLIDFTNAVVQFDPDNGILTRTILNADFIADIELNDRDELYVSDRTSGREGVRIFDADDGTEITESRIDVGDPPNEIVFVK
jgi:hypothetical protein